MQGCVKAGLKISHDAANNRLATGEPSSDVVGIFNELIRAGRRSLALKDMHLTDSQPHVSSSTLA